MTREPISKALHLAAEQREQGYAGMAADARLAVRVRRRRRAVVAGGALTSVLVLSLGGLGLAQALTLDEPAPAATNGGSHEPDLAVATVNPVTTEVFDPLAHVETCGAPAPAPVTSAEGFSVETWGSEVSMYRVDGDDGELGVEVTAVRDEPVLVHVSSFGGLFVQDGVVVAHSFRTIPGEFGIVATDGAYFASPVAPFAVLCDGESGRDEPLPEGEYDFYNVVHVSAGPEVAGFYALEDAGYALEYYPDNSAVYAPGSWDCRSGTGARPFLCADEYAVDRETGDLHVPYPVRMGDTVIDVTLVSEPQRFIVGPEPEGREEVPPRYPSLTDAWPAVPECDASFTYSSEYARGANLDAPRLETVVPATHLIPTPENPRRPLRLFPGSEGSGTIAFGEPLQAWILARSSWGYETETAQIVGSARLTIGDAEPIAFTRFAGPSSTEVEWSDVQWCGGELPQWTSVFVIVTGNYLIDEGGGPVERELLGSLTDR